MNKPVHNFIQRIGLLYGANRRLFLVYLLLVAVVLGRGVNYGFIGDEAGYVTLNTEELASHPLVPIVTTGVDTGHPMLYIYPVAVLWRIFGQSNAVANVSMWIWAAIALAALHRLMELILARASSVAQASSLPGQAGKMPALPGAAAAPALFSTPLFISLAAQYLDPLPYLALLLCMVLAWATRRRKTLAVLAGAVALVRITACLSVLGLGLFDLGYAWFAQRRRSWRALGIVAAPYAFSAAVFIFYLFIKLVVLGRPLSNIEVNKFEVGAWDDIRVSTARVLGGMLALPQYSFKPLLAVGAAGALMALWRAVRGRRAEARKPMSLGVPPSGGIPAKAGTPEQCAEGIPSAAAIYTACVASMFVPTLFYCLYPHYPQPRYLLPWHAFFALMGVHGLIALTGRRAWLVVALLAPWCGLQATRWHAHWVPKAFAFAPPTWRASLNIFPAFCLDVLDRKELCHEAGRWVRSKRPAGAALVGAYPTQMVFALRSAGFMEPLSNVYPLSLICRSDPETAFRKLLAEHPETWIVQASWDVNEERLKIDELMRGKPFKAIKKMRTRSGEWIRISYYQR